MLFVLQGQATDLEVHGLGDYIPLMQQLRHHLREKNVIRSVQDIQGITSLRQFYFEKKMRQKLRKAQGTVKGFILYRHLNSLKVDWSALDELLADIQCQPDDEYPFYQRLTIFVKPLFFDGDPVADAKTCKLFVSALEHIKKKGWQRLLAEQFITCLGTITTSRLSKQAFYVRLLARFNAIHRTPAPFKKILRKELEKIADEAEPSNALTAALCIQICAEPPMITEAVFSFSSECAIKDATEMGKLLQQMNTAQEIACAHRLLERSLRQCKFSDAEIIELMKIAWGKNKDAWIALHCMKPPTGEYSVEEYQNIASLLTSEQKAKLYAACGFKSKNRLSLAWYPGTHVLRFTVTLGVASVLIGLMIGVPLGMAKGLVAMRYKNNPMLLFADTGLTRFIE